MRKRKKCILSTCAIVVTVVFFVMCQFWDFYAVLQTQIIFKSWARANNKT